MLAISQYSQGIRWRAGIWRIERFPLSRLLSPCLGTARTFLLLLPCSALRIDTAGHCASSCWHRQALTPDGGTLYTGGRDGKILGWRCCDGQRVAKIPRAHDGYIEALVCGHTHPTSNLRLVLPPRPHARALECHPSRQPLIRHRHPLPSHARSIACRSSHTDPRLDPLTIAANPHAASSR